MYRVLIVDDEPAVSEDLNLMVRWEEYGFDPADAAFDGEEALEKLETQSYDLVITDIRMPGMSGLELLKALRSRNPRIKMLVLSGYGEFHYAAEAMYYGVKGYLLKPVDRVELTGFLQTVKEELDRESESEHNERKRRRLARDRFLNDLVSGILPEEEIHSGAAEVGFVIGEYPYMIALCEIEGFYGLLTVNVEEARNTGKSLRRLAEEMLEGQCFCDFYNDMDGIMGMVLHGEARCREKLEQWLHRLCHQAKEALRINLRIGCGDFIRGVQHLSQSRKNALRALERKFITTGTLVVSYEQVTLQENSLWNIGWESRLLLDAIECNDPAQIRKQLEDFIRELEEKLLPRDAIANWVFNVVFDLCALIKQSGGTPDQIFHYSEMEDMLEHFTGMHHLTEWLENLCRQTIEYRNSLSSDEKTSRIVGQVKRYLDENYHTEITIKDLSQMFYINSGYLGQLFKKSVGENVSDYVNKKRIAEVKKLSAAGNLPIGTILAKVGYHNPGYFYKKFRYYEGISFAEYNNR